MSEELKNAYEAVGKILDRISELERENTALKTQIKIHNAPLREFVESIAEWVTNTAYLDWYGAKEYGKKAAALLAYLDEDTQTKNPPTANG